MWTPGQFRGGGAGAVARLGERHPVGPQKRIAVPPRSSPALDSERYARFSSAHGRCRKPSSRSGFGPQHSSARPISPRWSPKAGAHLGDTAVDSAYGRTVHRFGYRFVADVVEAVTTAGPSQSDARMYLTSADRQFVLPEGAVEIGRSADVAIRIDAGGVSRRHARVVISGTEARVEDLNSKNGTFVDGKPVTGARLLKDGDEIRVGPVALTFRLVTPTKATETMESS